MSQWAEICHLHLVATLPAGNIYIAKAYPLAGAVRGVVRGSGH